MNVLSNRRSQRARPWIDEKPNIIYFSFAPQKRIGEKSRFPASSTFFLFLSQSRLTLFFSGTHSSRHAIDWGGRKEFSFFSYGIFSFLHQTNWGQFVGESWPAEKIFAPAATAATKILGREWNPNGSFKSARESKWYEGEKIFFFLRDVEMSDLITVEPSKSPSFFPSWRSSLRKNSRRHKNEGGIFVPSVRRSSLGRFLQLDIETGRNRRRLGGKFLFFAEAAIVTKDV